MRRAARVPLALVTALLLVLAPAARSRSSGDSGSFTDSSSALASAGAAPPGAGTRTRSCVNGVCQVCDGEGRCVTVTDSGAPAPGPGAATPGGVGSDGGSHTGARGRTRACSDGTCTETVCAGGGGPCVTTTYPQGDAPPPCPGGTSSEGLCLPTGAAGGATAGGTATVGNATRSVVVTCDADGCTRTTCVDGECDSEEAPGSDSGEAPMGRRGGPGPASGGGSASAVGSTSVRCDASGCVTRACAGGGDGGGGGGSCVEQEFGAEATAGTGAAAGDIRFGDGDAVECDMRGCNVTACDGGGSGGGGGGGGAGSGGNCTQSVIAAVPISGDVGPDRNSTETSGSVITCDGGVCTVTVCEGGVCTRTEVAATETPSGAIDVSAQQVGSSSPTAAAEAGAVEAPDSGAAPGSSDAGSPSPALQRSGSVLGLLAGLVALGVVLV